MVHAKNAKVGLWMIGACGGVGSAVALGVAALGKRLGETTGLVSELPVFRSSGLVDPGSIVVGGHEIRSESINAAVSAAHRRANLFEEKLVRACAARLRAVQRDIRPGTLYGNNVVVRNLADHHRIPRERSPAAVVERLSSDISEFRRRHRLDQVVVVHLASSEPAPKKTAVHARYATLVRALARAGSRALPPSSLYALAAVESGCAYINFTPSAGIGIPALRERAHELDIPYMGNDGKTGETLVKSVLAPMFAMRNLKVLSWAGQNLLGNRDGAVLDDARTRDSKIRSKSKALRRIIGGSARTHVAINFMPSLDDWKVAWDFIHFQGFLGTKMTMQFTWQGSDSALAAPLIIDLVRFAARERNNGTAGPMRHLAYFFKDPIDVDEHDLSGQWRRLVEHVGRPSVRV